ncbi:methyltransferase domain-containing protein [Flavobacterium psychrotolerans]|uniref:SAM-dependent methyltransferase n=1 Tax=Flavobacterium psychrotolerans TaxID=2169410 RepID=A0A2U1JPU1_9FLAO|nr:methyltransferase domain-containing protein [Flavobacterium psychrotolerans]PWA07200.1 SAM-dependent methyltransferase [Flavobacterium psychrotolerans]
MYQTIKKLITSIVPRKLLFEQEENLRGLYALFYAGNSHQCPVCNKNLKKFIPISNYDSLCPSCGSLQRNRRLWSLLLAEFLTPNSTVLDFSPSRCLYRRLKKYPNINYLSTDLSGDFIADYQFDITNLKISDNSLDLIICYHILEHIVDDITAMKELFRVMKPGAKALVQTPFKEGAIYEDFSIASDEERLKHFGQEDHVRIYSVLGLNDRLESCGFNVEIRTNFIDENKFGFDKNETILVLSKPLIQK